MKLGSGDVSVFLPWEDARLAESAQGDACKFLFLGYTVFARMCCDRFTRNSDPASADEGRSGHGRAGRGHNRRSPRAVQQPAPTVYVPDIGMEAF